MFVQLNRDIYIMHHDYDYKTEPYAHQREVFHASRDAEYYAWLMGMGTGKTKVGIDNAAWLWAENKIDAVVVVAPNGVHRNWILREIPTHLPDWAPRTAVVWASPSVLKAAERKQLAQIWEPGPHGRRVLRVISMNVEAFGSKNGAAAIFLRKVLDTFRTLLIIDESTVIKNPTAQRTKILLRLGAGAYYRRIMTGTPITNGPLDAYSQFAFLSRSILGYDNFYSFKNHFAEWKTSQNYRQGRSFQELVAYRNLDELTAKISAHSFRVTKDQCLDLPQKVFERRIVEMTKEQRKLYDSVRKQAIYDLGKGEITVSHVLTRLLRLQQILGGFVPAAEGMPAAPIPGPNPRLAAMLEAVEEANPDGKVIIWARFRAELAAIENALRAAYGKDSVVSYHGAVSPADREVSTDRFQNDPTCQFFVGQQRSGGYGLTLTAATTMLYYSNDFGLETRLQSEDRAHRIGQKKNVTYLDFEATDTIDSKIIEALRAKKNIADEITKDNPMEWL